MNGSWSAAGGIIVKSDDPADVGITFIQVTRDNGEGWDDQDASQALFYRDPATCAGNTDWDPGFPIHKGNYEIKDRD